MTTARITYPVAASGASVYDATGAHLAACGNAATAQLLAVQINNGAEYATARAVLLEVSCYEMPTPAQRIIAAWKAARRGM